MPIFSYTIKDKTGKTVKGLLEAESKEKLIEHFHTQQCIIFSIAESKRKARQKTKGKIVADDLVLFSRQFTTLIESGIPIVEGLDILQDQVEKPYFKEVLSLVLKDVREGAYLSTAFAKYPRVFPEIYISMVEAAEISGNLSEILDRVSIYLEKASALKKKIVSALYYPAIIIVMATGITSFLLFKVVPTFESIFDTLGGVLPLPTRVLLAFSNFLQANILLVIIIITGAFIAFKQAIKRPDVKRIFHRFLLEIPIVGGLIKKIAIAKFSRTFATLVRSGVSVLRCLDIVARTSGNKIIEDAVVEAKKAIQEGQPISVPLEHSAIFPPMVVKMIAVGERSGRLEEMLSKIAQFYEEQTDSMVSGLASLIEPIIIAFLGIIVGGIVLALFLPIIKMTQYLS